VDKRFVEREIQCDGVIERSEVIVYSGADTVAADFEKFFIQHLKRRAQLACCLAPHVFVKSRAVASRLEQLTAGTAEHRFRAQGKATKLQQPRDMRQIETPSTKF
jgi:hypothetical protein